MFKCFYLLNICNSLIHFNEIELLEVVHRLFINKHDNHAMIVVKSSSVFDVEKLFLTAIKNSEFLSCSITEERKDYLSYVSRVSLM